MGKFNDFYKQIMTEENKFSNHSYNTYYKSIMKVINAGLVDEDESQRLKSKENLEIYISDLSDLKIGDGIEFESSQSGFGNMYYLNQHHFILFQIDQSRSYVIVKKDDRVGITFNHASNIDVNGQSKDSGVKAFNTKLLVDEDFAGTGGGKPILNIAVYGKEAVKELIKALKAEGFDASEDDIFMNTYGWRNERGTLDE